jgi:hypothetical protein
MLCTALEYPVWELCYFCFLPEYTGNFAGRMKKRQNCNGKRKISSRATDLQQLLFIKKILSPSDETRGRGIKTPKTGCF